MKREELDRLAELRRKICGGGPVNGAAIAAWDDAIFAAAPALLAAAREAEELREWQREAAGILRAARITRPGAAPAIDRLLAGMKP